jgi:hypothetical protein
MNESEMIKKRSTFYCAEAIASKSDFEISSRWIGYIIKK